MSDDIAKSFESLHGGTGGRVRHPLASFFHVLFKASAIIVYLLLSSVISGHFIVLFLIIVLLLSVDFWVVKNITGRLMVGLRWWNKVEEDGTSVWVFESKNKSVSAPESVIFWGALFASPLLWGFFFFTAIIKFHWEWVIIPVVGMVLCGSNLVGYVKCRRDASAKLSAMAGQFIGRQILKQTLAPETT